MLTGRCFHHQQRKARGEIGGRLKEGGGRWKTKRSGDTYTFRLRIKKFGQDVPAPAHGGGRDREPKKKTITGGDDAQKDELGTWSPRRSKYAKEKKLS